MQKVYFVTPAEQTLFRTDGDSSIAISATNADAAFPATNLLTYASSEVFVTTSGTSAITFNMGRARDFNVVSIVNCTASYRSTILIEVSSNGSSWTTLAASAPLFPNYVSVPAVYSGSEGADPRRFNLDFVNSWYRNSTTQTYQYVRVTIADPINSSWSAGRIIVGPTWTPSTGIQYGSSLEFNDFGIRERTDDGHSILDYIRVVVGAQLKMEFASKAEMQTSLYSLAYWRGSTREILVHLDETDAQYAMRNILYCTMTENRRITSDSFNAYSTNFVLESI
jgi:hypothetical protein